MSVIRPDLPQNLPVAGPVGQSAQVKAAQAAFFRAALSEVQTTAPRPQAAPATQAARTPEPQGARLPRLGQHLDIRV